MVAARKRPDAAMWEEARRKEEQSFEDNDVFDMHTLPELHQMGVMPGKKVVPMRMLLTSKVKADGTFDKAKARGVLQGHTGHFPKHGPVGRGWAVVFTPTPNVVETRLFNALAVGENMSRFAFDVNVAFLNAESTEEERIPVRMPW